MTDYLNGESMESTEYFPFGSERSKPGINLSNYKYTDQEWDNEAGLYNYDARLYDPVIGRFITADTLLQDWYKSQSLNRYIYVKNNPLLYIDPTGHFPADFSDWGNSLPDPQPNLGFTNEVNQSLAKVAGWGGLGGLVAGAFIGTPSEVSAKSGGIKGLATKNGIKALSKSGIYGLLGGLTLGFINECLKYSNDVDVDTSLNKVSQESNEIQRKKEKNKDPEMNLDEATKAQPDNEGKKDNSENDNDAEIQEKQD
jgi:RHS repeat-associated protein